MLTLIPSLQPAPPHPILQEEMLISFSARMFELVTAFALPQEYNHCVSSAVTYANKQKTI